MPTTPAAAAPPLLRISCAVCTKTADIKKRLPTGWKHVAADYFCGPCWQSRYMLRAITLPVAAPVDLSWKDLRTALGVLWAETTRASNWIVRELALADVQREPGVPKMPRMPNSYLYPRIREQFPVLPSTTAASLEQSVTRKYKARRYEVIWRCKAALPTFRYPQPLPIPSQAWDLSFENNSPFVSIRIEDRRVRLRLETVNRKRQLAALRSIVSGGAIPGEAAVYEQGADLMVKLVAWLPRPEQKDPRSGILRVRSTPDAILVAANEKDQSLWTYNADQIRRWSAEHRRQLQRWADDSKFEHRPTPPFATRRSEASVRYHRRVNKAAEQIAMALVQYARRRKFAAIAYDDSDHSFCPEFVWFRLSQRIQIVCDEFGIEFALARADLAVELN